MYGLTRATLTLIGVAVAGVLLWLATRIIPDEWTSASRGEYWAALGLVALGGLAIAVSQLLGGWTKWGWPRISGNVFLLGFLPTLIAGGWILAAQEPENYWLGRHVRNWSGDIGIEGLVADLGLMIPAVALGIGCRRRRTGRSEPRPRRRTAASASKTGTGTAARRARRRPGGPASP